MGNTGSMTSADELNEQYDADGSVTQVPERNDEVHAGESAVAQSRDLPICERKNSRRTSLAAAIISRLLRSFSAFSITSGNSAARVPALRE